MAGFFLPAGYQMTLTADDFKAGSYNLFGVQPSGYTEIDAGGSAVVGPFAVGKQYEIVNLTVDMEPVSLTVPSNIVNVDDSDASGFGFVIDEDDMVSDLATKLPTQESVKAYVDTAVAALETDDINTVHIDDTDASGYDFVIDEDNMASNLDTKIPTQQSVKAYADGLVVNMITTADDITDLTALNEANVAVITDTATGAELATAVNGILAILIAAGLMAAPE